MSNRLAPTDLQNIIGQIMHFCVEETQELIADLEHERFRHNGEFNGHARWADNSYDVQKDKGFNKPLYDTGNLYGKLSKPTNWDLKPTIGNNTLKLTVPERENFTDKKYDKLDTGGKSAGYVSPRGNLMKPRNLPARPFKDISNQDVDWIVDKLAQGIEDKFS